MSTTIQLDDDVAAELDRIRQTRNISLSEAANDALRTAIVPPKKLTEAKPFQTRTFDCGRLLVDISCVHKALAIAESEEYRMI